MYNLNIPLYLFCILKHLFPAGVMLKSDVVLWYLDPGYSIDISGEESRIIEWKIKSL